MVQNSKWLHSNKVNEEIELTYGVLCIFTYYHRIMATNYIYTQSSNIFGLSTEATMTLLLK